MITDNSSYNLIYRFCESTPIAIFLHTNDNIGVFVTGFARDLAGVATNGLVSSLMVLFSGTVACCCVGRTTYLHPVALRIVSAFNAGTVDFVGHRHFTYVHQHCRLQRCLVQRGTHRHRLEHIVSPETYNSTAEFSS